MCRWWWCFDALVVAIKSIERSVTVKGCLRILFDCIPFHICRLTMVLSYNPRHDTNLGNWTSTPTTFHQWMSTHPPNQMHSFSYNQLHSASLITPVNHCALNNITNNVGTFQNNNVNKNAINSWLLSKHLPQNMVQFQSNKVLCSFCRSELWWNIHHMLY